MMELGVLKSRINAGKKAIDEKDFTTAKLACFALPADSTSHFLYHQSFAYAQDIQDRIYRILECVNLLQDMSSLLKDEKITDNHWSVKEMTANFNDVLLHMTYIDEHLGTKIIESMNADEVRAHYRKT